MKKENDLKQKQAEKTEVKFEDSFRGEIERYLLASTQAEQDEAVKIIKKRDLWIAQ